MVEVRINLTPDPAFDEVAQLAERLAYQSKAENRDLTDDELKTLHAALDKYEGKVQNQPRAKLTTLRDDLRRDIAKTKAQARDFTPDEINQMTEYFRQANREIYKQKKINVSGAEADRLLRKVQFTENNPEQTPTDREM